MIDNFWVGDQQAYGNSIGNEFGGISKRQDYEQLKPCCGAKESYSSPDLLAAVAEGKITTSTTSNTGGGSPKTSAVRGVPTNNGNSSTTTSSSIDMKKLQIFLLIIFLI